MTFQRCTTFDQTLKLKELGLPQCNGSAYVDVRSEQFYAEKEFCSLKTHSHELNARVLTRQEIEDILMEQYDVETFVQRVMGEGAAITKLYQKQKPPGSRRERIECFPCPIEDPFESRFNALVWHLEQKAGAPTTKEE